MQTQTTTRQDGRSTRGWRLGLVAVLALALGFVARGAIAGDDEKKEAGPENEKPIDGHALVKALAGAWTTKATTTMGAMEGKVAYALDCGNTVLVSRYATKSEAFGDFHGLGVLKISADGKTATQWWFDTMMPGVLTMTGPVTETGYTLEGSSEMGSSKVVLAKKEGGFEFKMWANGEEFMTETYTKSK